MGKPNEKTQDKSKYWEHIAMLGLKSAYSYRILMLLQSDKAYTHVQLSTIFGVPKQNITKSIKELDKYGLIFVDRVEGRNKFLRIVSNISSVITLVPGQTKLL